METDGQARSSFHKLTWPLVVSALAFLVSALVCTLKWRYGVYFWRRIWQRMRRSRDLPNELLVSDDEFELMEALARPGEYFSLQPDSSYRKKVILNIAAFNIAVAMSLVSASLFMYFGLK